MSDRVKNLTVKEYEEMMLLFYEMAQDIRGINTWIGGIQARIDGAEGQKALYSDQITVGVAAANLQSEFLPMFGAILKADSDNTDDIYIGGGPGITVARYAGELSPENFIVLPLRRLTDVWHISGTADQLLSVWAM